MLDDAALAHELLVEASSLGCSVADGVASVNWWTRTATSPALTRYGVVNGAQKPLRNWPPRWSNQMHGAGWPRRYGAGQPYRLFTYVTVASDQLPDAGGATLCRGAG